MRKLALPAVMAGLMSLGFMACDTNGTDSDATGTTDTVSDTGGTDTLQIDTFTPTTTYTAIYLEDLWDQICHSTSGAEGADITAVELLDDAGNHIAYFDSAALDSERSDKVCPKPDDHNDTSEAAGAPSGSDGLLSGYYSLWGGWLIGEFEGAPLLQAGDTVKVFEIDDSFCTGIPSCIGSEKYDVYVAEDIDCPRSGTGYRNECMVKLTDTDGANGSVTIDLAGF